MSPNPRRRRVGPKLAKDIASAGVLKTKLGYPSFAHGEFWDTVKKYPSNYKARNGLAGNSLTRWRDVSHQKALEEMVQNFLDDDGNGIRYWPNNNTPGSSLLQYSEDGSLYV